CHGASPSSPSSSGPLACGMTAAFCSGDNAVTPAPSSETRPAKNPFSHERCSSVKGADSGTRLMIGGVTVSVIDSLRVEHCPQRRHLMPARECDECLVG